MGLFDKFAFWRKQPELPDVSQFGRDSGFKGPGGFGESGVGKGSGPDMGQEGIAPLERGKSGFESVGLGDENKFNVEPGMPDIEQGYGGGPGLGQGPSPGMQQQQSGAPMQRQQFQQPQQQPFGVPMQPVQPKANLTLSKDFDIISSKLDALKATLDGVNQRLSNLERMMQNNKKHW